MAHLFIQPFEFCLSSLAFSREARVAIGRHESWGFSFILWDDGGMVLVSETEGGGR